MKFIDEFIDEIKLVETPSFLFLLKQAGMIICVMLVFASHFEVVDYVYHFIANLYIFNYLSR